MEVGDKRLSAVINIAREHNLVGIDHLKEARGVLTAIANDLEKVEK